MKTYKILLMSLFLFPSLLSCGTSGGFITFTSDSIAKTAYMAERTIKISGHEFTYYNVYSDGNGDFVLADNTSYIRNYDIQFGLRFKYVPNVLLYDISNGLLNPVAINPIVDEYENGDRGYSVHFGFEIRVAREISSSVLNMSIGKMTHWC